MRRPPSNQLIPALSLGLLRLRNAQKPSESLSFSFRFAAQETDRPRPPAGPGYSWPRPHTGTHTSCPDCVAVTPWVDFLPCSLEEVMFVRVNSHLSVWRRGLQWVTKKEKKFASAASCCRSRFIWSRKDRNMACGPRSSSSQRLSGSITHKCVMFSLLVALPPLRPLRPLSPRPQGKEPFMSTAGRTKDAGS